MASTINISEVEPVMENTLRKIEKAVINLFDSESFFENICEKIRKSSDFDFSALHLINLEESVIETVCGTGIATLWSDIDRHYLEEDPELRDIHADIVKTHSTEIISGWDDRFDKWIYNEYEQEEFQRIFTPVILVRDSDSGKYIEDWFEYCRWDAIREENGNGWKIVINFSIGGLGHRNIDINTIGTVEAGFKNRPKQITQKQAINFAKLIGKQALRIRYTFLPYVLETIVEHIIDYVKADSASLHYNLDSVREKYIYEALAGKIDKIKMNFLKEHPPRSSGLGRKSIDKGRPLYIPDSSQQHDAMELKYQNPGIYEKGIRAIAAFPLIIGRNEGVLYIHYHRDYNFDSNEIRSIELFTNRVVDAIRHTTSYLKERNRAKQLSVLHSISHSIAFNPEEENLIHRIACNALNMLAADVVTIYPYHETEKRFSTPPEIAGRLVVGEKMITEIRENDAPEQIVKEGENHYCRNSVKDRIMNNPNRLKMDIPGFVNRERIESSAGILLRVGEKTLGIMFINYRRFHDFPDEEKKAIETLASAAAISMKNRRLFEQVNSAIDFAHKVSEATVLEVHEKTLESIVHGTKKVLNCDSVVLYTYDEENGDFDYPPTMTGVRIREKVIEKGRVTRISKVRKILKLEKNYHVVNNMAKDDLLRGAFTDREEIKSAIAIGLITHEANRGEESEKRIVGVMFVNYRRYHTFSGNELKNIKLFSNQAAVAIRNYQLYEKLRETKGLVGPLTAVAWMGLVSSAWRHNISQDTNAIDVTCDLLERALKKGNYSGLNNKISKIRKLAKNISKKPITPPPSIEGEVDLVSVANLVLERLKRYRDVERYTGVKFDFRPDKKIDTTVRISPDWFIQVLDILIDNAVKAMKNLENKEIKVNIERTNGKVSIFIRDTGCGIKDNILKKLFKEQIMSPERKNTNGVGLLLAQTIIQSYRGKLAIRKTEVGKGTTIMIELPFEKKTMGNVC